MQLVPRHLLMIEILFPDDNMTRSGRIGFILGVWLPLVTCYKYFAPLAYRQCQVKEQCCIPTCLNYELRNHKVTWAIFQRSRTKGCNRARLCQIATIYSLTHTEPHKVTVATMIKKRKMERLISPFALYM